MQLQQLIYFMTVADQGSFNKAAEKLFATQPNLSKAISNLESELKVKIFYRTNRGVELTEERMYRVIEMVESGEADLGFVMSNQVQLKELRHILNFKGIELHLLGMDTWYANLGPAHPLYDREEVTIRELLEYPFIRRPDDYFSNLTHYLEIDGVRLTNFTRVVYSNDSAAMLSILKATDAFRFGPGLSAADFAEYGIRTIPIQNCKIQITTGWLQRKRESLSEEARSFVSMLQKLYPLSL